MSDSNKFADISRRSIDPDGREDVEKQMEMIYNGNDYTPSILPLVMADGCVMPIRQAAVISLKKNLRNLVKEASSLFANIQSLILDECCMAGNEPLTRDIVLKNSRCYRAVIESNMNTTDCMETKNMLHQINILWNLVEILYIDVLPAGNLVEQLLIWIRYHYPNTNLEADAMLKNNEVHEHPSYWTIILKFVVRGEIKMAAKLLKLHPDCETNENLSFIHILMEKMPQFTRNCMKYEFFAKWQAWNMQVKTHFRKSVFTSPEERTILGLLCGDFGTFSSNKHLFESWYHLMVAFLHFADPLVAEIDIPSLAFQSLTTYLDIRSEEQAKPYDRAILKAFAYDLMAVVQESCSAFKDGWWFCTHFIDLLYHGGILEGIEEPRKLREFFILDYADVLMGDDELWSNAVNYYASCSEFGLESLRLHLESKPLDTEETRSKIIQICEKHNLDDVIRVVYIVIARKALTENNLGQALLMAARSKSPVLASHIADIYLKHFVEKKKFPDQKALDSLGPLMLTCDKLTFLAKYNEFLECKKRGSLLEAGVQLENLISSKIAPNFFIFTLLMDAVSLLEAEMLILNFEQTYQVLVALENFANMMNEQTKDEDVKNKENYLRLAIARNMARAMIFA